MASGDRLIFIPAFVGMILDWPFLDLPDDNWLFLNGSTIGDASSGATALASANTESLFTKLWTDWDNTKLPIQNSSGVPTTRGASAAADFAAHKRLPLPDARGRAVIGAGQGSGLTNRVLGVTVGAESANIAHTHDVSVANHTHSVTVADHTHALTLSTLNYGGGEAIWADFAMTSPSGAGGAQTVTSGTGGAQTVTSTSSGSSTQTIMQPSLVMNKIIFVGQG